MTKKLVTFFSATGTTAKAARALAEAIGADTFEIEPAKAYTAADLDWTDSQSRTTVEKNDESARPEITGVPDVSAYDVVFVGFPIWWYQEPRIVDTFLEQAGLAGKTVVPFATSGGSSIGKAEKHMALVVPEATVTGGRMLNGALKADDLRSWAEKL